VHTIENRYRDGVRWQSRTADVEWTSMSVMKRQSVT
jgi:hypothetical protein